MSATPPEPYGSQFPDPVEAHLASAAVARVAPPSILAAVRLMYVGAGLSVLAVLYDLTTREALRDRLADDDPDRSSAELDRAANLATGVSVVIALIAVGLWLWMARANGRGLLWARIVATVLFGLNIVLIIYDVTQTTGFGVVLDLISIVLAGAILWLLYRPDSGEFYTAVSGRPRPSGIPPTRRLP